MVELSTPVVVSSLKVERLEKDRLAVEVWVLRQNQG